MELPDFTPDCAECAGLCCMAQAFDKGEEFAFAKPALHACKHLDEDFGCKIHAGLVEEGMSGCTLYDCLGAGPRVVHETFAGADWRADPDLKAPMAEALRIMRKAHEAAQLLDLAGKLPLPPALEAERVAMLEELTPEVWEMADLEAFEARRAHGTALAFLTRLRDHAAR